MRNLVQLVRRMRLFVGHIHGQHIHGIVALLLQKNRVANNLKIMRFIVFVCIQRIGTLEAAQRVAVFLARAFHLVDGDGLVHITARINAVREGFSKKFHKAWGQRLRHLCRVSEIGYIHTFVYHAGRGS